MRSYSQPDPVPIRINLWMKHSNEYRLMLENASLELEVGRLRNGSVREAEEGFKCSRDAAFDALSSERNHMARIGHGAQPVGQYILLMEHYLLKARDEWACSNKPPLDELDNIRKVGALVVACLEAHGAPPRVKSKAHPIEGQPDVHAPR